jgi:hypothetical protein
MKRTGCWVSSWEGTPFFASRAKERADAGRFRVTEPVNESSSVESARSTGGAPRSSWLSVQWMMRAEASGRVEVPETRMVEPAGARISTPGSTAV